MKHAGRQDGRIENIPGVIDNGDFILFIPLQWVDPNASEVFEEWKCTALFTSPLLCLLRAGTITVIVINNLFKFIKLL